MSSDNPFAVSDLYSGEFSEQHAVRDSTWYEVGDEEIVCGSTVELPRVCIYSGLHDDLESRTITSSFPSLRLVIRARSCTVRCWVSRPIAWRKTWGRRFAAAMLLFSPIMCCGGFDIHELGLVFGVTIFTFGCVLFVISKTRLVLDRFEPPGRYHVVGFSRNVLAELRRLQPPREGFSGADPR